MKVLHVNVRLSEGGAAGVARTLCDELTTVGVDVTFAYGYGPNGAPSRLTVPYSSFQITPKLLAGVHRAAHLALGHESKFAFGPGWEQLKTAIHTSDVVHLHVLHSYYLNIHRLFALIKMYKKPVVWTLHDHWALTGRCAQPAACDGWRAGCQSCPALKAYPPAAIDRASIEQPKRAEAIRQLQASVPTAVVACASWLGRQAQEAGLTNVKVIENSVDRSFWNSAKELSPRPRDARPRKVLFLCRDLRDDKKVDWELLSQIGQLPNIALTIAGDHATIQVSNANHQPAVDSRSSLARLMTAHDTLLFTSTVDYYPLTVAEALTAGMDILACDSPALREFSVFPQVQIVDSPPGAYKALAESSFNRTERQPAEAAAFHPTRMATEYLTTYESLTGITG